MIMVVYPRPHARTPARLHARTPARLKHSTLKLKIVHAKILSCARPHARTMQSYKARLLYMHNNIRGYSTVYSGKWLFL